MLQNQVSANTPVAPSMLSDFRGTLISIGDTVVYPRRRGSAMWMVEGTVEDFGYDNYGEPFVMIQRTAESAAFADSTAQGTIEHFGRTVRVSPTRLTVVSC